VYMIFAMGAFDLGVGETADTAQRYFETARTIFKETLLEEGSIELVQALAIMGNYLQRRDTPNSGYMCLGLAIRMATALGLHNPSARQGPSPLDDEMRHRIWWGLVTLEAGCSLTFGRPPMLGYASLLTSRIPANVDDEDLRVGSMQPAQESAGVTLYSAVITQARLAKVAFFLQDRLARSLPAPTVAQIQWCGEYFRREVALLPPGPVSPDEPFALARAVQIWRMRDYQSVIYRPVFLASAWDPQSRSDADSRVKAIIRCVAFDATADCSSCRTLATENVRDISLFAQRSEDYHRGCQWYILYFSFQACLTLLLSIVREPTHPDAEVWRKDVEETITMYQRMTSKEKVRQRVLVALTIDRKLICTFHGDSPRRTTNTYERAAG
jgi:transcriptional regulatory protein GAL4